MGEGISLYDEISRQSRVEGTWEKWKDYRRQLTDFIMEQIGQNCGEIVIVGAGACHDIDLERLADCAEHITLLDNDASSLLKARLHAGRRQNIACRVAGVDGIQEADYRDFCEQLLRYIRQADRPDLRAFDEYAITLLTRLFSGDDFEKRSGQEGKPITQQSMGQSRKQDGRGFWENLPQADVCICIGLCSQLQTMFAYPYHVLRNLLAQRMWCATQNSDCIRQDDKGQCVDTLLMQRNRLVIPKVHDVLLGSARQKVILGNEYRRSLCKTEIIPRSEDAPLLPGEAIEGAYQAICDIRARLCRCTEYTAYWPFDEARGSCYEMILQVVDV